MDDKVRIALRDLLADKGQSLLASTDLLRGLLSDDCPECTEEINVLTTAVEAHLPSELRDYSTATETRVALNASILRLERGFGLQRPAAAWAVVTLANVLNHIPDEEFQSLLVELGGEPSLPSAPEPKRPRTPTPSAPPLSSTPPPARHPSPPSASQPSSTPPPPPAATPHPPPPPMPRRTSPPPPRPAPPQAFPSVYRTAGKAQPAQSSRIGKIVGIIALGVLGSWIAIALIESQSQTPDAPPSTSPPSQTQPPAESGPVTSPPPEPQPLGTQPAPSAAPVVGDAPGALPLAPAHGPKLISQVAPVYPPLAKQARIQGLVAFKAVIATDGTVKSLKLVGGHPLLVPAAQAAVKQWRYEPTLLNGVPVEVATRIDVNFTLSQ